MKYYTIFLGNVLWQDVIDDMNSGKVWGIGGMLWKSKRKAEACMKNLQIPVYGLENKNAKFKIVELELTKGETK